MAGLHLWLAGLIRRCGRCSGGVGPGSTSAVVEGFPVKDNIGQIQIAGAVVLQQHVNVSGLIQNKAQLGDLVAGEGNGQPPGRVRALHQGTRRWRECIDGGFDRRGVALEKAFKRRSP